MRVTSFILFGLLSCIYVRGAEEASTTQYPARNTTSVDTTSVETPENTTPISSTTEFQALIEPITEELILHLQTKNTVAIKDSSNLLSEIEDDVVRFSASLNQQLKDVQQLGPMELQFAKSSYLVKKLSLNLLQGLSNTTYKVGLDIKRTVQTLENMVKEEQEIKKRVNQLQEKLNDYQNNIVNSSQVIDNSIVHLTKLVSRSVLPKLDNLKSQFSNLNTSQINIKAELPNIEITKAINEKSIRKLNDLNQQLAYLNHTKDTQLQKVTDILEYLAPKNLTVIANTLQDLVIEEKRIDLKLSINEQLSTCSSSKSKTAYRVTKSICGSNRRLPVASCLLVGLMAEKVRCAVNHMDTIKWKDFGFGFDFGNHQHASIARCVILLGKAENLNEKNKLRKVNDKRQEAKRQRGETLIAVSG
ncbi:hypothetical protein ACLKA7_009148 [Drosophila subpalustris]